MGNTIIHFSENKQEEADVFLLTETYTNKLQDSLESFYSRANLCFFLRFLLRGKAVSLVSPILEFKKAEPTFLI